MKDFRIVFDSPSYYITEVEYDETGKPIKELGPECGILSYWASVEELKESYESVKEAFNKPILLSNEL